MQVATLGALLQVTLNGSRGQRINLAVGISLHLQSFRAWHRIYPRAATANVFSAPHVRGLAATSPYPMARSPQRQSRDSPYPRFLSRPISAGSLPVVRRRAVATCVPR